jgi:hypothetical protein
MLASKIKKIMSFFLSNDGRAAPLTSHADVPFDNSYTWLWTRMEQILGDPVARRRPQYAYGVLQGAALAKVLGLDRVSVIEVGVAGGAGLLAMERAVELCEREVEVRIDVFGFDSGTGMPKPKDYRDIPYKWSQGYYPGNIEELKNRLSRADLRIGLLSETVPQFLSQHPASVAFVGFDACMFSATSDALRIFTGTHDSLLPRVPCSFRSAIGKDFSDYTGELLAIAEFNRQNAARKLSPIRGLQYFVPSRFRWWWVDMMYSLHVFDHPLYGAPDAYKLSSVIDIDDNEEFHPVQKT